MIFVAYLLLRRYGGPGSDKLAAGMALFGMANVPFIYVSVNYWRTLHPQTSVVPTLPVEMGGRCGSASPRSCCCSVAAGAAGPARAPARAVEALYLARTNRDATPAVDCCVVLLLAAGVGGRASAAAATAEGFRAVDETLPGEQIPARR